MAKIVNPDQEKIKDANNRKILHLLMKKRQLSKQDISRLTKISITTVTGNINRLIEDGLAEEAGVADSTGGRKPMIIRFLPNGRYAFGVDFASNHLTASNKIKVVLINLDAEVKDEEIFDYHKFSKIDDIMQYIKKVTENITARSKLSRDTILGIGFALPGPVNERKKILELAPNLASSLGMKNVDFTKYNTLFPYPVYVENEANAAAYGELVLGTAKNKHNLVYLSINRGIGAGLVVRGHIYKGKNRRAGEIGHMTVASNGIKCTCGRKDCWEIYAASGALIRNFNKLSQEKITDTEQFLEKLKLKDKTALKVWDKYLSYLTIGINNLILGYDPHYIIIGGEISEFNSLLLNPLKKRIFENNSFYKDGDLEILLSHLKEDASLIGAALLPFQKLFYGNNKII
ncbi:MAG: ROK family transcriptional regulator [Spirochaetales bacterium]|nr:ROK family transcriptional regulator [Spirochaetales bacterium]